MGLVSFRSSVSAGLFPFSFPLVNINHTIFAKNCLPLLFFYKMDAISYFQFGINVVHLNILPNDIAPQDAVLFRSNRPYYILDFYSKKFSFDLEVPKQLAFLIPGQFPE